MNNNQYKIFQKIRKILNKMHKYWVNYDDDQHHKRSEGAIEVYYPNWFETNDYENASAVGLGIYSYLFGESRMHHFDSFPEALKAVIVWHNVYVKYLNQEYDLNLPLEHYPGEKLFPKDYFEGFN